MTRPRKAADDGPGITRLPKRRTYRCDSAKDIEALGPDLQVWARKFKQSRGWTFDGFVVPAERLARKLAPREPGDDEEPLQRSERPARGAGAWIAQRILDSLDAARSQRGRGGEADLIEAFEAGQWYGHLLTKLAWETDALSGERSAVVGRLSGKRGGRKPLIEPPERLREIIGTKGAHKRRLVRELAGETGAEPESVLRAARRWQKRASR